MLEKTPKKRKGEEMENNLLRLKGIQFFADDETDGESEKGKTYSQEEFDNLKSEMEKIKRANDKLSSENADYKRKAKEKLSEDEKKLQEQKEKDEELENTKKELLAIKLSKEFMVAGFDEEQTNELIESFNGDNPVEFAKTLSKKIKELVDNVKKSMQEEFNKSSKIPDTSKKKSESGIDPIIEKYINKKTATNDARKQILKN